MILNINIIPLVVALGKSRKATAWVNETLLWGEFTTKCKEPVRTDERMEEFDALDKEQQNDLKDRGGYVGGPLTQSPGKRCKNTIAERTLLTLDVEQQTGGMAPPEPGNMLETIELILGFAGAIHTTRKDRPESRRYRILLPLSRAVTPTEYSLLAQSVIRELGGQCFDEGCCQAERFMYWPTVSQDQEYFFCTADGDLLNPDDYIQKVAVAPVEPATALKKLGDPTHKPGIVGAFNRVYGVTEAIAAFLANVYAPADTGRFTYINGSSAAGLIIYGNLHAYSNHSTDPANTGHCLDAFNLVMLHKFGATNFTQMARFARRIPEVSAEEAAAEFAFISGCGKEYLPSDVGNSNWFTDRHGRYIRFVPEWKIWSIWNGSRWEKDDAQTVTGLAIETTEAMLASAEAEADKDRGQRLAKHAIRSQAAARISSMISLSQHKLACTLDTFDGDPMLLNCKNGVIDLKTGDLLPPEPAMMCSKMAGTTFGDGQPSLWLKTLNEIFCGDKELIEAFQIWCGYNLTGLATEQVMSILYGDGSNGKSLVLETMREVMGDYAAVVPVEAFLANDKSGNAPSPEIAGLQGRRFISGTEISEGRMLNEAIVKSLTGGDTISARYLNQNPITFQMTGKFNLSLNSLPRVPGGGYSLWRRMLVIPFNRRFADNEKDTDLPKKLREELPGILRWAVDGCLKWQRRGLLRAEAVKAATNEYQADSDIVGKFFEEVITNVPGGSVPARALYQSYRSWCREVGCKELSEFRFAHKAEEHGLEKKKTKAGIAYIGVRMLQECI